MFRHILGIVIVLALVGWGIDRVQHSAAEAPVAPAVETNEAVPSADEMRATAAESRVAVLESRDKANTTKIADLTRERDAANKQASELRTQLEGANKRADAAEKKAADLQYKLDHYVCKVPEPKKKLTGLAAAIEQAKKDGKDLLVNCRQTSCTACDDFDRNVWSRLDTEKQALYELNVDDEKLPANFKEITRTPTVIIIHPDREAERIVGPSHNINRFLEVLYE